MHFDALTLTAVAAELNTTIRGGRVQQILRPDAHSLAACRSKVLLLPKHPIRGQFFVNIERKCTLSL